MYCSVFHTKLEASAKINSQGFFNLLMKWPWADNCLYLQCMYIIVWWPFTTFSFLCSLKLLAMWLLMTFTHAMTQPTRTAVDWPPQSRRRSPHAVEYAMVCTGLNTLVWVRIHTYMYIHISLFCEECGCCTHQLCTGKLHPKLCMIVIVEFDSYEERTCITHCSSHIH